MEATPMRVLHYAKRSLAALVLAALAAGCGGESTAPDAPFDPEGTSADVDAMESAFDSPAAAGFAAASEAIGGLLGESPAAAAVRAMPTKDLVAGGKPGVKHYSEKLARAYLRPTGGIRPSLSAAAIPPEYLGVTFTYNVETDEYEPSELTGAPDDGVRFIVYAVNGISGEIVEPLVEVGHADIVTTESASAMTVRIVLVSGDVTFLDYTVGATVSGSSTFTLSISGSVSNGDDTVNFDLDNVLTEDSAQIDYTLTVPSRGGFRIDFEGQGSDGIITLALEARGPHGTVAVEGSENNTSGSYEVEVNGEPFATITTTTGEPPVITGADGEPLSDEERAVLLAIYLRFLQGFDFFEDLIDPIPIAA
jgi:hypothetical protein